MNMITDYKVVHAIYTEADADGQRDKLSSHITDYIAAGWQPHGPLSAATLAGVLILMQPMVKYEKGSGTIDP